MLILASRSPRRREILERAGIPFLAKAADVDEQRLAGEEPAEYVQRLARAKAEAIAAGPGEIVLGADTAVVFDRQILSKPAGAEEAAQILRLLSGREHLVVTGICLKDGSNVIVDAETTRVRLIALSEQQIRDYVSTGEPIDKAGAYAIQGLASRFIDRIEGCYFNIVGLPIALVYRHLNRLEGSDI